MLISAADSCLLLVDYQARLMPAIRDGGDVLRNAMRLAQVARLVSVPVIGTEQNPAGLGPLATDVRALCGRVLEKTHFDACAEGLLEALPPDRPTLVVAGCEAHVCLLQTALGLHAAGQRLRVVADACGSRSPHNRDAAMARLAFAGIERVTTEMVIFEWLRHSGHPAFRNALPIVK